MEKRDLDRKRMRNFSFYLKEEEFPDRMADTVEPFLENRRRQGSFTAKDGTVIHYCNYALQDAKALIVISHGFCEFAEKYNELVYYFLRAGYSVFMAEHRGHGKSGRMTGDSDMVYVKSYQEYVDDLKQYMDQVVLQEQGDKLRFLFAHSMGGAVGALILEQEPRLFQGAVLSSPMLEVNTGKVPARLALWIAGVQVLLGKDKHYIVGQHAFEKVSAYASSSCMSRQRYSYIFQKRLEDADYRTNGGAYGWLLASIRSVKELGKKKNAAKIEAPVLLFQAGKDTLVKAAGQERFAARLKWADFVYVHDSRHEIYNAEDEVREAYLEEIFDFFERILEEKEG